MPTKLEKKLTELAREFDLREVRVQTEDRRDYFIRFENGILFGCWDWTLPEDKRAQMEMMQVKATIDRHYNNRWLLGYHHEEMDGFVYRYADGRYDELAQHAREDREAAA